MRLEHRYVQTIVFQVRTDKRGRATGVAYYDRNKHEHFQKARALVVSANGAETARLLLNSADSRFPNGLANSSGFVGKYLMFNCGGDVGASFEHELNEYKSVQVTRLVHDFYNSDPKRGFYGGGGIDGRLGPAPAIWALAATPGIPRGRPHRALRPQQRNLTSRVRSRAGRLTS